MPYTPRWRAHRRMFHQEFYQAAVQKYRPVQLQYAREFLSWIANSPQHTRKHVRQMVTSIIFFVTYGKRITGMDDEAVSVARTAVEGSNIASVPGMFWVEYLPFLRHIPSWMPGATFKKRAEYFRQHVCRMKDEPYDAVKSAVDNGTATTSVAASLIQRCRGKYSGTDEEGIYDEISRNVAGLAYAAGADTTTSACESFLLAMAMFPDVQKKARAELDRVVGLHRLPEFEDLQKMPYIRATVMESMRWMPALPMSVPHAVIADDVYKGYHIPKGTVVIPNAWAMLRDPEDYPEPEKFMPERFIGEDGNIDPAVRDPSTVAFGFGRRTCLGKYFSNNTLSIFIASVLHIFDINAGIDASGDPVKLCAESSTGLIISPKQVPTWLKPRSEAAASLITKFATEAETT